MHYNVATPPDWLWVHCHVHGNAAKWFLRIKLLYSIKANPQSMPGFHSHPTRMMMVLQVCTIIIAHQLQSYRHPSRWWARGQAQFRYCASRKSFIHKNMYACRCRPPSCYNEQVNLPIYRKLWRVPFLPLQSTGYNKKEDKSSKAFWMEYCTV